jgi:hypothetical protein
MVGDMAHMQITPPPSWLGKRNHFTSRPDDKPANNPRGGKDMITGYVYGIDSMVVVAEINGNQRDVERYVDDNYDETCGLTYSPAFGANDGLIQSADADIIYV